MNDIDLIKLVEQYSLKHIAIIMDGNGRWAKNQLLDRTEGHKVGVERVVDIVEACDQLGIKVLSLYAFSTENWKRPEVEVKTLFKLLNIFVDRELKNLIKKNVKLQIMGDISQLPLIARKAVEMAMKKTASNTGLILNIGINYGSRAEIELGIKKIIKDVKSGKLDEDSIDENTLGTYLYTNELPDPDLLIRTGGEERLSNFMLYQLAYTEFYFTKVLWPEFDGQELRKAILYYLSKDRRFGGLNEE